MSRAAIIALIGVVLLSAVSSTAVELDEMTTEELRLLYFGATQGYLAPHVARCFLNSLELHRELWGWEPSQPVTVLLVDLSDRGNAAAGAVPRNMLMLEIAPLSFVYEIVSANERMNWLMNHELVHIAAVDGAAGRDHFWRKFFAGKVQPNADNPGTILFAYLTTPATPPPAGIRRASRSLSRPGWRAVWGAPRAPGTRWSSAPWCATAATSTARSVWSPREPRSTSRSRSTPISTAPASCPTWRTSTDPRP